MDYNNNNDRDRDSNGRYRHDHDTDTKVKAGAAGAGIGIGTLVIIAIIAIAAYFLFNGKNDNARSAGNDVGRATSTVVDKVKDGAAEVPQAAKDATTPGDQKTTRPNADDSNGKLDQK